MHLALGEQRALLAVEDREHLRERRRRQRRCAAAASAAVRLCGGEAARRWGGAAVPLRVCVCSCVRRWRRCARRGRRAPAHLVGADGEELLAIRRVADLVRVRLRVRGRGRARNASRAGGERTQLGKRSCDLAVPLNLKGGPS